MKVINILVGNQIKTLRKQKGITQEQLGSSLGISTQAVSKWENNIALPDITLIPSLANFFNVSIDELFGHHLHEKVEKIKAICDQAYGFRESNPAQAKTIIENGLKSYPDDELLLNHLLYACSTSDEPDYVISIASKLISLTDDAAIRYDALRFLAYAFKAKGEMEHATAALEQLPELYFSKLAELAFVATGTVKYEAAEKQKWISIEVLLQMMEKLSEHYADIGNMDAARQEAERALAILNALTGEPKIDLFHSYNAAFNKRLTTLS